MSEDTIWMNKLVKRATGSLLAGIAWAVTGVRPIWAGAAPSNRQRIYFANHASHGDFILLASCLPREEREQTRAVAAADYWGKTRLRRLIANDLLSTVLIERKVTENVKHPMQVMLDVLEQGDSLIIFPEGTRNMDESEKLLPFRSGLYNLALARPDIELIPCWIENMSRVLPKGKFLPVPLLCRVIFGPPMALISGEERHAFLARSREALLSLDPRAKSSQ
ncbi:MAG: 1-acyl-sn-glycerol-3-phosphate acyltransferase [Rhizobiaceae bacterium]|nr:1-acyl-sn-glycerol-3-phosphate acyltransferase [Rhizobiaceae bacterium]